MDMRTKLITRRLFGTGLATGLLAAGSAVGALAADAAVVTDCRGRRVNPGKARRIVSVGGAVTETLYALGAADRIVGVDSTSTWPEAALHDKPSVGYMRALSSEGVLALRPDLVLTMNNAGPPTALDQLMASRVPVIFVDSTPSAEAIVDRTRFIANLMQAGAEGDRLCADLSRRFESLTAWRAAHPLAQRVLFVMRMTNNRPMVAGTGTAADAVIRLTGAVNAGVAMQGYKIVDQENLLALKPDVILVMAQGSEDIRKNLLADPGFRLTSAGRSGAIISMEGERLLGLGLRTPEAALELAQKLAEMPVRTAGQPG